MAIPLSEPAAEHKAVRKQIKKLKKVQSTGDLDAAGAAELKELKKKSKALKRAASQATLEGGSGSDGGEATAEASKKKRKQGAAEAAPTPAQQQQQPPAKKKQKKNGSSGAAAATTQELPSGMAAVGDRRLAASRPALVKALYTEAADVAAMPADKVAAWHKERKTKVEGCALNPITSFAQSGEAGSRALCRAPPHGFAARPASRRTQRLARAPHIRLPPCTPQACPLTSCTRRAASSSPRPSSRSACPSR